MDGITIDLLVAKTGISLSKLKSIIARNGTLQEMPYSVKNGKYRIFFEPFIKWLEEYEGVAKVAKHLENATNATNGKLPSGPQIKGMADLYGAAEARKRIDFVLGYNAKPEPTTLPAPRLSKAAFAVEMKEQQKARDKAWQQAHERLLF